MEYVPINNIKQEVESATHNNQEVESLSTGISSKNNNSSQAAPDSAENKVSATMKKKLSQPNIKFLCTLIFTSFLSIAINEV